jgi:hypothetical protein
MADSGLRAADSAPAMGRRHKTKCTLDGAQYFNTRYSDYRYAMPQMSPVARYRAPAKKPPSVLKIYCLAAFSLFAVTTSGWQT